MAEVEEHLRSVAEYPTEEALLKALQEEEKDDQSLDWVLTNYDVGTTIPLTLQEELLRLQTLQSYLRLDETADAELDRLTAMASRIFRLPIALVSLIDIGKQWFLSNHGLGDAKYGPRRIAVCAHALCNTQDVLVVPDCTIDLRFAHLPQVVGPPRVTFYAGTPLLSPEGYKIGSFCLVDDKPRHDFSEEDRETLVDLAATAMDCLIRHRETKRREQQQFLACTAHDWLTPLMGLHLSLSLIQEEQQQLSRGQQEMLSKAIRGTRYMQQISQSTLDVLKKETMLLDMTVAPITDAAAETKMEDCEAVVDMANLVETLQQLAPNQKQVQYQFRMEDTVPALVFGDELKLLRASLNLLAHFAPSTKANNNMGGRCTILFRIFATPNQLVFECSRVGTGDQQHMSLQQIMVLQQASLGAFKCKCHPNNMAKNLGIQSVERQIQSLGGTFGHGPFGGTGKQQQKSESTAWFQIPLI